MTCCVAGALAELVPHLALFISLVGAFASTALSLVFPPIIELLCSYAAETGLDAKIWSRNLCLLVFALTGFLTGTYASLVQIAAEFGKPDHL